MQHEENWQPFNSGHPKSVGMLLAEKGREVPSVRLAFLILHETAYSGFLYCTVPIEVTIKSLFSQIVFFQMFLFLFSSIHRPLRHLHFLFTSRPIPIQRRRGRRRSGDVGPQRNCWRS
jgi:hypothetical protein